MIVKMEINLDNIFKEFNGLLKKEEVALDTPKINENDYNLGMCAKMANSQNEIFNKLNNSISVKINYDSSQILALSYVLAYNRSMFYLSKIKLTARGMKTILNKYKTNKVFIQNLAIMMNYFIVREEYEHCALIKKLLDKLI